MKKTIAIMLSFIMATSMIPFTALGYDGSIADIDLVRNKPLEVYYEVDGSWDTDVNDEPYFRYNGFIGRGTGDVFTIYDDENNAYEYTCEYRDGEFILVGEDGDEIPYDDVEMIDEQNQPGRHFNLGDANYFTIEYKGIRKDVFVSVILNPVDKINYIPVSDIQIVENTGGHWDTDGGENFYSYDTPDFRAGDILEVTYAGEENPIIYTYSDEENEFFDAEGYSLPDDNDGIVRSKDTYAKWSVADGGEYEIIYSGRRTSVKVQIIENTVTAIDYERNGRDEYIEGDTRYDAWDDAYYYEHPNFREGDILTVYEGEKSTRYICKKEEDGWDYYFESEDGSKTISCDWKTGVHIDDNQRETPWVIGTQNEFFVEYMGYREVLYADVTENPVEYISYKRANPDKYLYEVDGSEYDGIFEYWLKMADEGDILTVKEKSRDPVEYTCVFNEETWEREFVSAGGAVIDEDEVNFYADQRNNPWTVGSNNPYTVSYSGCKFTLYATVEVDPIESIEYRRGEVAEYFENTDGWDNDGKWMYNEPDFLEGDTLTVYYTDAQPKTFTFRYYEEIGYSAFRAEDGEILDDIYRSSQQWETPWTIGDDNEYFVVYHGKKSNPQKVIIRKNTVTGIDFISAKTPVIYAEDKREMYYPPTDEMFWGYELPFLQAGDKLIVHDSEAGDIEYVFTRNEADGELYFVSGDKVLARDSVYIYENQYEHPWAVGGENNYFTVEYLGQTAKVPVSIVESNVESIEYTVANPERLVLLEESDKNGRWEENRGEEFFFYDFSRGYVGDTLKVNYKDGTSSVYTVKFDGAPGGIGVYLENDEGDRIDQSEVEIFDNQWEEHWYIDEDNRYFVKYKGATDEIHVTITHDFEKKVIKPTCTEKGYTLYTCRACGEEYEDNFVKTVDHNSDKGTITTKPTYTKEGVKTYKCVDCGKKLKTEKIAKLAKKTNTIKAKGKTVTVKYSSLKKKTQSVTKSKAYSISKAKGTLTYSKSSGNSKIKVDKKTGKITIKKGLKKGTYKLKVKIKAAGTTEYKAKTVTVTVTIKVK